MYIGRTIQVVISRGYYGIFWEQAVKPNWIASRFWRHSSTNLKALHSVWLGLVQIGYPLEGLFFLNRLTLRLFTSSLKEVHSSDNRSSKICQLTRCVPVVGVWQSLPDGLQICYGDSVHIGCRSSAVVIGRSTTVQYNFPDASWSTCGDPLRHSASTGASLPIVNNIVLHLKWRTNTINPVLPRFGLYCTYFIQFDIS